MKLLFLALLAAATAAAQGDSSAHHAKAKELAAQKQWDAARSEYLEALRLDPKNQAARLDLARMQILLRQYEPALATVNTVLLAETDNVEAELVRAAALIGLNKPGVARLFLLDALKKHPDHAEILFQLGVVAMADRRWDEALDSFRKTWKVEPSNARGIAGQAEVYLAQKEPDQALKLVQAEAEKLPDRRDLQLLLGNTAARADQLLVAITAYQRALPGAAETERVDLYLRLSEVQRRSGDMDASIASMEKARELAPREGRVLTAYAMLLDTAGRKKDAGTAYAAALEVEPKNAIVLNNYAFLLAENGGDLKQALELAQRAREVLPNSAEVNDTVGWIYVKANMLDAAIGLLQILVTRRPDVASFRYHYAVALERKGDKAGAKRELQEAIKRGAAGEDLRQIKEFLGSLE